MVLLPVLVPCLVTGVIFAGLATWLSTTKGNSIAETMKARQLSDEEAIKIVLGKLTVASNLPIVALYIVALFAASLVPSLVWWTWTKDDPIITIRANFDKAPEDVISVAMSQSFTRNRRFSFEVPYSDRSEEVTLTSSVYSPVSIDLTMNRLDGSIVAKVTNSTDSNGISPEMKLKLGLGQHEVSLDTPIRLLSAPRVNSATLSNKESVVPTIRDPKYMGKLPDPTDKPL